jgi:hypothetical protein
LAGGDIMNKKIYKFADLWPKWGEMIEALPEPTSVNSTGEVVSCILDIPGVTGCKVHHDVDEVEVTAVDGFEFP